MRIEVSYNVPETCHYPRKYLYYSNIFLCMYILIIFSKSYEFQILASLQRLIDAAYDAMTTHSYEIQYVMSSSKFNVKSSL